jgi:YidC/Oxa1 family membrane protein insertase
MDERRALIAVVLVFVVLLAFNVYQGQQRRRLAEEAPSEPAATAVIEDEETGELEAARADERTAAAEAAADESAVLGEAAEAQSEGEPIESVVEEVLTTIEAPLWTATLSSRGGSIVSWRLAEYRAASGDPVELVPEGVGGLSVRVRYGPDDLETAERIFEYDGPESIALEEGAEPVTLTYRLRGGSGVGVERAYTFYPDRYAFDVAIAVEGAAGPAATREIWLGWPGVLATEEKEGAKDLAVATMVGGRPARIDAGKVRSEPVLRVGEITWATAQSRYFMTALVPESPFTALEAVGEPEATRAGFRAAAPIAEGGGIVRLTAFAGPQDYRLVSEVEPTLERAIDMGWRVTRPLSVLVLKALVWAHGLVPNYGVIIIIFSIITKLLFYRLTHKSFTEMKRMQDLQPRLEELKKKHANNKEELARAQMNLYKDAGVNPLGSCFPMLLQMPVFIALFQVLRTTIELRGAPFALWITDLSQPDTIAAIAGFPIHVLPLLMGIGMLVQQQFSSRDPSQAMMGKLMPIVFTALFYNFASGLVLYWLVNTVLSVAQQYYIHRGPSTAGAPSADAAAPAAVASNPQASSGPAATEFIEDAEVVDVAAPATANPSRKKRGGKRRKKRKKR